MISADKRMQLRWALNLRSVDWRLSFSFTFLFNIPENHGTANSGGAEIFWTCHWWGRQPWGGQTASDGDWITGQGLRRQVRTSFHPNTPREARSWAGVGYIPVPIKTASNQFNTRLLGVVLSSMSWLNCPLNLKRLALKHSTAWATLTKLYQWLR